MLRRVHGLHGALVNADALTQLVATPDIAVRWAVAPSDAARWRAAGVDCFLRWIPEQACWCRKFHRGVFTAAWEPVEGAAEYAGRLIAFHPEGTALVLTASRTFALIPIDALREDAPDRVSDQEWRRSQERANAVAAEVHARWGIPWTSASEAQLLEAGNAVDARRSS